MQENGGVAADAVTKEMQDKINEYRSAPEEKLNEEFVKLTIHK